VNLDALTYAGNLISLGKLPDPKRHTFIQGGVENSELLEKILREHEVTRIVHFAAETHVDRSIIDPELFIRTNVIGTYRLLMAALKYWEERKILDDSIVRFHHISTDEVFGALGKNTHHR
jgi:dTDP-glucose 4,6-dehydratase